MFLFYNNCKNNLCVLNLAQKWIYKMIAVLLVSSILLALLPCLSCCSVNPPQNVTELYGREKDINKIINYIKNSTSSVVINIFGAPGIGKSEIAKYIGNVLQNEEMNIFYVDLNQAGLSLHSLNAKLSKESSKCLRGTEKIQLLIFDNCGYCWHDNHLITVLSNYVYNNSKLVVLITTRNKLTLPKWINFIPYPLREIPEDSCISLVVHFSGLHAEYARQICSRLNNIPLAVQLAISAIKHDYNPSKVNYFLSEALNDRNRKFNIFTSLDGSMNQSASFIASAFWWNFKQLATECHEVLNSILQNGFHDIRYSSECVNDLVELALIEKSSHPHRFQIRSYVKELLLIMKSGSHFLINHSVSDTLEFWTSFSSHYQDTLLQKLKHTEDIELAVKIGSNPEITNSLLPLIYPSLNVTPLLQCASRIIENYCSKHDQEDSYRQLSHDFARDVIYAIGYLTKRLFCPMVDTVSLLKTAEKEADSEASCMQCVIKLEQCLPLVKKLHQQVAGNFQVMEAHSFFHRIYGTSIALCDYHWNYDDCLIDLANLVSFARRRYQEFYNQSTFDVFTHIEVGLEMYSHLKINETRQLMWSGLQQHFADDQCNFIMKVIAILVLHILDKDEYQHTNLSSSLQEQVDSLLNSYPNPNMTCFLVAYKDFIIPFFYSIGHPAACMFQQHVRGWDTVFDLTCKYQNLPEKHCVRKRYELSHGSFLFNADELKNDLFEIYRTLREPLVCSMLRDIAVDCSSPFPSPFGFIDEARKKHTEQLIKSLREFVPKDNEESLVSIEDLFKKNNGAYQYTII